MASTVDLSAGVSDLIGIALTDTGQATRASDKVRLHSILNSRR
jgi:hypothetical protein